MQHLKTIQYRNYSLLLFVLLYVTAHADTSNDETMEPDLDTKIVCTLESIWNDKGSGADLDGFFYLPSVDAPYYIIGGYGTQAKKLASTDCVLTVKESEKLVAPVDWELIWKDKGSGARKDGSMWRAIPPSDEYICVGTVPQNGYEKPSISNYRCVHSNFTEKIETDQLIWNDTGSGAKKKVSMLGLPNSGSFVAFGERLDQVETHDLKVDTSILSDYKTDNSVAEEEIEESNTLGVFGEILVGVASELTGIPIDQVNTGETNKNLSDRAPTEYLENVIPHVDAHDVCQTVKSLPNLNKLAKKYDQLRKMGHQTWTGPGLARLYGTSANKKIIYDRRDIFSDWIKNNSDDYKLEYCLVWGQDRRRADAMGCEKYGLSEHKIKLKPFGYPEHKRNIANIFSPQIFDTVKLCYMQFLIEDSPLVYMFADNDRSLERDRRNCLTPHTKEVERLDEQGNLVKETQTINIPCDGHTKIKIAYGYGSSMDYYNPNNIKALIYALRTENGANVVESYAEKQLVLLEEEILDMEEEIELQAQEEANEEANRKAIAKQLKLEIEKFNETRKGKSFLKTCLPSYGVYSATPELECGCIGYVVSNNMSPRSFSQFQSYIEHGLEQAISYMNNTDQLGVVKAVSICGQALVE